MTPSSLEQIRDQQRDSWNKFSPGWKKWDAFNMEFLRPIGEVIIRSLDLRDDERVLDVAAGTGEPGLTIAKKVTKGKVIAIDLAEGMLKTAVARALAQHIVNFEIQVADACALPFPDGNFDAVSCRMGFMFFPDMTLAATEMARVLKPGGKLATAVWAPPLQNPWISSIVSVLNRLMSLPSPPPGSPGMFRCTDPVAMKQLLENAGFQKVRIEEFAGKVAYLNKDQYWHMMADVSPPVVTALAKADDALRGKIKDEVFALLDQQLVNGEPTFTYTAFILSAEK
jgi:ubiquinone/menaquinone biosynthesis C-methylase UbiE